MTIALSRATSQKAIDQMEEILKLHMFGRIGPKDIEAISAHFAMLRSIPAILYMNCKLETIPELQMTRIVLEASHTQPAPFKPS